MSKTTFHDKWKRKKGWTKELHKSHRSVQTLKENKQKYHTLKQFFCNIPLANFFIFSAKRYSTDDLVQMLLGKCTEVEEFSKCRRLLAVDKSFHQQYETSLAKIQTQISKLHRELSASEQEKDKKLLTYAELLLQHWGIYFWNLIPYIKTCLQKILETSYKYLRLCCV